jgi:hypothetical protein
VKKFPRYFEEWCWAFEKAQLFDKTRCRKVFVTWSNRADLMIYNDPILIL